MDWIKVTDRMPPPNEICIVTALGTNQDGDEVPISLPFPVVWEDGEWCRVIEAPGGFCDIVPFRYDEMVTHWMLWPEAAEDA